MKLKNAVISLISIFLLFPPLAVKAADEGYIDVYRMFNPRTGEHLYTGDENEVTTLYSRRWGNIEGAKWESPSAPVSDDGSSYAVYRLYNTKSGEHLFTSDEHEKDVLPLKDGNWTYEHVAWYSDPDGDISVCRLFNKYSGEHLFTADANEVRVLSSTPRWNLEGILCMAKAASSPVIQPAVIINYTPVYYSQRDQRWADITYGGYTMSASGCAPTADAMAISGITGTSVLPTDTASYLYNETDQFNKGYGIGATGYSYKAAADHWNIVNTPVASAADITDAVSKGRIVLLSVGPGSFTSAGYTHAIVLFQYSNGNTQVYDPYNADRNGWYSIDSIWNQRSTEPIDWIGGYVGYALG